MAVYFSHPPHLPAGDDGSVVNREPQLWLLPVVVGVSSFIVLLVRLASYNVLYLCVRAVGMPGNVTKNEQLPREIAFCCQQALCHSQGTAKVTIDLWIVLTRLW